LPRVGARYIDTLVAHAYTGRAVARADALSGRKASISPIRLGTIHARRCVAALEAPHIFVALESLKLGTRTHDEGREYKRATDEQQAAVPCFQAHARPIRISLS